MTRRAPTAWQRRVLADVAALADAFPGEVEIIGRRRPCARSGVRFRLRLRTSDIPYGTGGIRLRDHEQFIITVGPSDLAPPTADVDHLRFLGHAHVLLGTRLCLYLDPAREWDPHRGFGGFLDRLRGWLVDAAAGAFDARTALFHAVGGVLHASPGAPTVVVRQGPMTDRRGRHGWLVQRGSDRLDLLLCRPDAGVAAVHVPVLTLDSDMPLGAGATFDQLLCRLENPYAGYPAPGDLFRTEPMRTRLSPAVLTALAMSAVRKQDGTSQPIVLVVPHPAGGAPHLLAAALPAAAADHLRTLARESRKLGVMTEIDPAAITSETQLNWWLISDERAEVTTRRDSTRPVASLAGTVVHVWGCGGIGSWVAEFVVRAGARRVVLCDPATINGGLLVRQNFEEADVGGSKVDALARRLRAISDLVEVCTRTSPTTDLAGADVVIDTTVSIAVSRLLDIWAISPGRPVLAQMATDTRTATQGVMTVSMPPVQEGPLTIDRRAGETIAADGSLEPFHGLWAEDAGNDDLVPTRGCSVPTFHGSAADLASVAGCLVSILGSHLGLRTPVSGTHLVSLPHGEAGPLRRFVPAVPGDSSPDTGAAA